MQLNKVMKNLNPKFIYTILLIVFAALPSAYFSAAYAQTLTGRPSKVYVYEPNKVFTVETGLGIATQIVLDPSEQIKDYGTGFSSGWDIVRRDKRSYLFDLKIVTKDWKKIDEAKSLGVAYQIEFTYTDSLAKRGSITTVMPRNSNDPTAPVKSPYLNFHTDYEAASENGSKWLVPIRVYDDGELTYVHMPAMSSAPAFFGRLTDRGDEFILNRSMKNGIHVLQGVYPFIIVRYSDEVIAIRRR
jgi:type IV secretion system protein VirB9